MTPVLLDTGVIVALLDASERFHKPCLAAVQSSIQPLVTCEAVIAESCYLLRKLKGAPETIVENVASGVFQIPFDLWRSSRDVKRILAKYRDRPIDFADACLVRMAEELGTGEVLTLDRDFRIYRWGRNKPFTILGPMGSLL